MPPEKKSLMGLTSAGNLDFLLSPAVQDGSEQQEPAVHPRGHQLHLPQLRDCPLPAPGANVIKLFAAVIYDFS